MPPAEPGPPVSQRARRLCWHHPMKIDWKALGITVLTIVGVAYGAKLLKQNFPNYFGWLPF